MWAASIELRGAPPALGGWHTRPDEDVPETRWSTRGGGIIDPGGKIGSSSIHRTFDLGPDVPWPGRGTDQGANQGVEPWKRAQIGDGLK